jgi:hypothetical protein
MCNCHARPPSAVWWYGSEWWYGPVIALARIGARINPLVVNTLLIDADSGVPVTGRPALGTVDHTTRENRSDRRALHVHFAVRITAPSRLSSTDMR